MKVILTLKYDTNLINDLVLNRSHQTHPKLFLFENRETRFGTLVTLKWIVIIIRNINYII